MVKLRKNFKTGEVETFDSLLKRWRTEVNNAGILKEYRILEDAYFSLILSNCF